MSDFLNKYPYTDFHELNLDWVIERVKKLTEDWLATQQEWNNTEEQWQQLYDYVHDYFANLDVQDEINNKINQMILDGTFMTIVSPTINQTVVDATTSWLADHITQPTTPVIDNTLSIGGAAADAQVTGLALAPQYSASATYVIGDYVLYNGQMYRCTTNIATPESWTAAHWTSTRTAFEFVRAYMPRLYYNGDLNSCTRAGSYYLGNACSNYPTSLASVENWTLFVVGNAGYTGNYMHQFLFNGTLKTLWHRMISYGGTISQDWENLSDDSYMNRGGYNSDLNNLIKIGTYYLGSSCTNFPTELASVNTYTILIFPDSAYNGNYVHQFLFDSSLKSTIWHRMIHKNGTVQVDWEKIFDNHYTLRGAYNGDLNLAINNGTYFLRSGCTNYPAALASVENWTLFVFSGSAYNGSYNHQFLIDGAFRNVWHRLIHNNGTIANDWDQICDDINTVIPELNGQTDMVFWGDSLTAGAGGGGTTFPDVCATALGLSYYNYGAGGETVHTIAARQGGNNLIIPAGAVNGTYTLADFVDAYGKPVHPLRQGSATALATTNPIKIDGQTCTLAISQQSPSDPNATYTISGFTGTLGADAPALFNGYNKYGRITVILAGTNDIGAGDTIDDIIPVIKSMVTRINNKYVIMGLTIGNDSSMNAADAKMLETFGNHYFPSRRMLVDFGLSMAGITPTAQDTTDMAAGAVPTSLRYDGTHLNAAGYTVLGTMLASKIRGLGYV